MIINTIVIKLTFNVVAMAYNIFQTIHSRSALWGVVFDIRSS